MPPYARFETTSSSSTSTMEEDEEVSDSLVWKARVKTLARWTVLVLMALTFLPWLLSPSKHGLETIVFPLHSSVTVYTLVDTYPEREQHKHAPHEEGDPLHDEYEVQDEIPTLSPTVLDENMEEANKAEEEAALKVIQAVVNSSTAENELKQDSGNVVDRLANTSYCACVRRSSLVSKACNNSAGRFSEVFQILITGVGRSGTDFIHAELWRLGIRMSHDNHPLSKMVGSVAWPEAFNALPFRTQGSHYKRCSHPSWNFHRRRYGYKHVFHLVRDPLHTIQSRYNLGKAGSFSSFLGPAFVVCGCKRVCFRLCLCLLLFECERV